jgi:hypothetical protein
LPTASFANIAKPIADREAAMYLRNINDFFSFNVLRSTTFLPVTKPKMKPNVIDVVKEPARYPKRLRVELD